MFDIMENQGAMAESERTTRDRRIESVVPGLLCHYRLRFSNAAKDPATSDAGARSRRVSNRTKSSARRRILMERQKITLSQLEAFLFKSADILAARWMHLKLRIHLRHAVPEATLRRFR